jgi:ADP-ribose pyrophosphatase
MPEAPLFPIAVARPSAGLRRWAAALAILVPMANKKKKSTGKAKIVSSKTAYKGPVFSVSTDYVREPGGVTSRRDVIHHTGSVVIMAVDDSAREPRVLLARQYRHPARRVLLELPAGRIDEGENALAAAKRELVEETGYTAKKWKRILYFWASPGFLDETMAVYMATGLTRGKATPEEDENITIRFYPLSRAVQMVTSGAVHDGKTIASVLWLSHQNRARR